MLIVVAYQVASTLNPNRFRPSEQTDLAAALNTEYYPHKFRRILLDTIDLCAVGNLSQLHKDVLSRMSQPRLDLRFAPTLCQALADVLYECDLEERILNGFPALLPYLELAK